MTDELQVPSRTRYWSGLTLAALVLLAAVAAMVIIAYRVTDLPETVPSRATTSALFAGPAVSVSIEHTDEPVTWLPPATCAGVVALARGLQAVPSAVANNDLDEVQRLGLRMRWKELNCPGKFPND